MLLINKLCYPQSTFTHNPGLTCGFVWTYHIKVLGLNKKQTITLNSVHIVEIATVIATRKDENKRKRGPDWPIFKKGFASHFWVALFLISVGSLVPRLSTKCVQCLAKFFCHKPDAISKLRGKDRALFLSMVSTKETITLTAEKIPDEVGGEIKSCPILSKSCPILPKNCPKSSHRWFN